MEVLIKKIEQWANDRNIIKGSKPIDQAMKLFSEFGELADNVGKGRDCRDDIGDIFTVLTIMISQCGESISDISIQEYTTHSEKMAVMNLSESLVDFADFAKNNIIDDCIIDAIGWLQFIAECNDSTLEECVQLAYDDIKERKGILINGVFIKESDPAYAQVIAEIEANHA